MFPLTLPWYLTFLVLIELISKLFPLLVKSVSYFLQLSSRCFCLLNALVLWCVLTQRISKLLQSYTDRKVKSQEGHIKIYKT